ncbi:MAG: AAA family ATPase [Acidaminococcaceae bacterium]|nr:AAA family ATPase [Acidaminococcaceae bacterium]
MSSFDKVIGYEDIKAELIRICDVVKNPEKYARLGVKMPRGIMLWGEPGLGKSLMAQCFIEESGCKPFVIRKDKPDGELVNGLRDVFEKAKAQGRAIVFLDDLDKFANEDNQHPDAEEYVAVQACIDSCKDSDVFVFATANDTCCLPESLLRSGRFGKVIELKCPKGEDAVKVMKYYLFQKKSMEEVDAAAIAGILEGRSCADLEMVVNEAGIYAVFDGRDTITQQDMLRACMRLVFEGPEHIADEGVEYSKNIAVHEAGHAVVSELLSPGSVNLVSIRRYAGSIGGFVSYHNTNEYAKTAGALEQEAMRGLGGKAAIEVVYGQVCVGSSDDMNGVFQVVDKLVDDNTACGFETFTYSCSSEWLLANRNQVIAKEVNRYYKQTKRILAENREFLDKMAAALMEKKTLLQKDIREIRATIMN